DDRFQLRLAARQAQANELHGYGLAALADRWNGGQDPRPRRECQAVDERAVAAEVDVVQADGVLGAGRGEEGQDRVLALRIDGVGDHAPGRVADRDGAIEVHAEPAGNQLTGDRPGLGNGEAVVVHLLVARQSAGN